MKFVLSFLAYFIKLSLKRVAKFQRSPADPYLQAVTIFTNADDFDRNDHVNVNHEICLANQGSVVNIHSQKVNDIQIYIKKCPMRWQDLSDIDGKCRFYPKMVSLLDRTGAVKLRHVSLACRRRRDQLGRRLLSLINVEPEQAVGTTERRDKMPGLSAWSIALSICFAQQPHIFLQKRFC